MQTTGIMQTTGRNLCTTSRSGCASIPASMNLYAIGVWAISSTRSASLRHRTPPLPWHGRPRWIGAGLPCATWRVLLPGGRCET